MAIMKLTQCIWQLVLNILLSAVHCACLFGILCPVSVTHTFLIRCAPSSISRSPASVPDRKLSLDL